jgi:hypothetical protein
MFETLKDWKHAKDVDGEGNYLREDLSKEEWEHG